MTLKLIKFESKKLTLAKLLVCLPIIFNMACSRSSEEPLGCTKSPCAQGEWFWYLHAGEPPHSRAEWDAQEEKHRKRFVEDGYKGNQDPTARIDYHRLVLNCLQHPGANLRGASLFEVHLRDANLNGANLSVADMNGAELVCAQLVNGNLSGANLDKADLTGADLRHAEILRGDLYGYEATVLTGARLTGADLSDARFEGTKLDHADLSHANLLDTTLLNVALTNSILRNSRLVNAQIIDSDVSGADLTEADLTNANLKGSILKGTRLSNADLRGAIFEPKELPEATEAFRAKNLGFLRFESNGAAMIQLKKQLRDAGFYQTESEVNAAIWRMHENIFFKLFLDCTCEYGSNAVKPLWWLSGVYVLFAFAYWILLHRKGQSCLITETEGNLPSESESVCYGHQSFRPVIPKKVWWHSESRNIRLALRFSLENVLRLGFREFNMGHWLNLLRKRESVYRPRYWFRTLAGIQSLFSLLLIALWILSSFTRAFDKG